jgi:hypothetical protein
MLLEENQNWMKIGDFQKLNMSSAYNSQQRGVFAFCDETNLHQNWRDQSGRYS